MDLPENQVIVKCSTLPKCLLDAQFCTKYFALLSLLLPREIIRPIPRQES